MSQNIIRKKMQRYLELTSQEYIADLDKQIEDLRATSEPSTSIQIEKLTRLKHKHKKYIQQLHQDLNQGYCYGFAICHGAMDLAGKLSWWEHALIKIFQWNEDPAQLSKSFILRGANNDQPISLRQLFELVINHVLSMHGPKTSTNKFLPAAINFSSLLQPDTNTTTTSTMEDSQHHFEMLGKTGELQTIKQRKIIAGYFSQQALQSILTAKNIKDTLCLIHSNTHVVRLGYHQQSNHWIVYNPNYHHASFYTIHFIGTQLNAINEIFSCLGTQAIAIEVATTDAKKIIDFSFYDKLLEKQPIRLLREHALYAIARHTAHLIPHFLTLATHSPKQRWIRNAFIHSLVKPNADDDWNLLHYLACFTPLALIDLFNLAYDPMTGNELKTAITNALSQTTLTHQCSGLQHIAWYAPASLPALFRLADESPTGITLRTLLIHSLSKIRATDNWTGLYAVGRYARHSFASVIQLALTPTEQINSHDRLQNVIMGLNQISADENMSGWELMNYLSLQDQQSIQTALLHTLAELTPNDVIDQGKMILSAVSGLLTNKTSASHPQHRFFVRNNTNPMQWMHFLNQFKSLLDQKKFTVNQLG